DAVNLGRIHGYRNAQATVLAPTGTIGLMMDCDTPGIEPDLALVKYKKLVGGGMLKIVNGTVPAALRKLGYDSNEVKEIVEYIDDNDTIEGAPHLVDDHLKVFDCAFKPVKGARSIAPMGHVRMMAGVQPFISGSMSKTVNLPTEATDEDGQPGELFVTMAKEGSTISGLMDAFATQTSYALQFGVPLKFMVDKFTHMRFEPSGFTKNPEIPIAKSIVDYIFRWMAAHFLPAQDAEEAGVIMREPAVETPPPPSTPDPKTGPGALKIIAAPQPANGIQKIAFINTDAPACADCGAITVRSGSCYKCLNCGATTGCS